MAYVRTSLLLSAKMIFDLEKQHDEFVKIVTDELNKNKETSEETKTILKDHAEKLKKKQKRLSLFENATFSLFSSNITGFDVGN